MMTPIIVFIARTRCVADDPFASVRLDQRQRKPPINTTSAAVTTKNTVLMTGKSGLSMTLRTIPGIVRKKPQAPAVAPREIYESGRGYF